MRWNFSHAAMVIFTLGISGALLAADRLDRFQGEAKDAWLTGKIETVLTLNSSLNSFDINTEVEDGRVTLLGEVSTEIDRDLAGQLVQGVEGVAGVRNELVVTGAPGPVDTVQREVSDAGGNFMDWVEDVTTTAVVKTRLLADPDTKGLRIDVDTENRVVTLNGEVESDAARMKAEQIALRMALITEVHNNLVVVSN